jgi:Family of unknown function (DUF6335)
MARKKAAKKAKAKSAKRMAKKKAAPASAKRATAGKPKKAARRTARAPKKASRKSAPKASRPAARTSARAFVSATADRGKAAKPARKPGVVASVGKAVASVLVAGVSAALASKKKPNLDRPRKTVADVHGLPSSLDMGRSASAAKTGRAELNQRLSKNTSASPALTAGDVDADWQSAETVGDEAPGGDNPTPDQDVVDDIGRALGVEYADDEELQGGAEIKERDRHRWELDPASKDEFDEES